MNFGDNLFSRTGWEICERVFDRDSLITNGSNFMVGNGYLGYRGTFPEWTKEHYVGCVVSDTYDTADGTWKELSTVPNALYAQAYLDGVPISLFDGTAHDYRRELDFRYGIHMRSVDVAPPLANAGGPGRKVTVTDWRFASYRDLHLVPQRIVVGVPGGGELRLRTGIDADLWSLHGNHFRSLSGTESRNGRIGVEAVTGEHGIRICVGQAVTVLGEHAYREEIERNDSGVYRSLTFRAGAGEQVELVLYMAVYTSNDADDPAAAVRTSLDAACDAGYDALLREHCAVWDSLWDNIDIKLDGDSETQALLRYNLYQAVIATPAHTDHLPIGARGLSCQAYQGAAFWDQEVFNLPMYLFTRPDVARSLLTYRHKTIAGARGKAADLGYRGAFYAWVSAETGDEICPSYFFTDVLTGRKIRNHFNDWQIHVSPDIAYAVWNYYQVTDDWEFMRKSGAEIIFDVAQFLVSRAHFKKDRNRYEFIRLLGPDEYHENVDNNFFTAYQARFVMQRALALYAIFEERDPGALREIQKRSNVSPDDIVLWTEMAQRIFVPEPDEKSGLIEQFDGYFQLEDITPGKLAGRLIDPAEYWGWPNGIAVETQVSKQADVVQLFMIHPKAYPVHVMRANCDYYEPRTQHGSSLSPSVYAIVGAWTGNMRMACDYFQKSLTVDLLATNKSESGGTFIGGIHTAACGVAWQIVVRGFCGLYVEDGTLGLSPHLPESWAKVRFSIFFRGQRLLVTVRQESVCVSHAGGTQRVRLDLGGKEHLLEPSKELTVSYA